MVACAVAMLLARGVVLPAVAAAGQPGAQPLARSESGLTLEVEGFCSQVRMRTSNARITWRVTAPALTAGLASLAPTAQRLETTVFKNGFERGLFVTLPITAAAPDRPVAAVAPPTAAQQPARRAYQIRLIEMSAVRAAAADDGASEMDVVVENLEPGMNYSWRLTIDAPSARMVSPVVSLRARICPSDEVEPRPATPRRRP